MPVENAVVHFCPPYIQRITTASPPSSSISFEIYFDAASNLAHFGLEFLGFSEPSYTCSVFSPCCFNHFFFPGAGNFKFAMVFGITFLLPIQPRTFILKELPHFRS